MSMADKPERKPIKPSRPSEPRVISRPNQEPVRLMISGSRWGIQVMIHTLFKMGFAPVDAWSKPQKIPNSDRLMSVMTRFINKPKKEGEPNPSNQDSRLPE